MKINNVFTTVKEFGNNSEESFLSKCTEDIRTSLTLVGTVEAFGASDADGLRGAHLVATVVRLTHLRRQKAHRVLELELEVDFGYDFLSMSAQSVPESHTPFH